MKPAGARARQRGMKLVRALPASLVPICLLACSACGSERPPAGGQAAARPSATAATLSHCAKGSGFALSLASDRGGRATPVAAAAWFAQGGSVAGVPRRGWKVTSRTGRGAVVSSGSQVLHAVQGPDRTWQIDSGYRCA